MTWVLHKLYMICFNLRKISFWYKRNNCISALFNSVDFWYYLWKMKYWYVRLLSNRYNTYEKIESGSRTLRLEAIRATANWPRSLRSFLSRISRSISSLSHRYTSLCPGHDSPRQIKLGTFVLIQPSDSVPCIQDVVLNFLLPITEFYTENKTFGLILVSIMQVIVDVQLIGMLSYWAIKGQNLRYPIVMAVIGISKMLLNVKNAFTKVLFQTKLIDHSFTQRAFPSLFSG